MRSTVEIKIDVLVNITALRTQQMQLGNEIEMETRDYYTSMH